jgi:hypothetical protein
MANKKFLLGILIMLSVFEMMVISCASEPLSVSQSLYRDIGQETFSKFRFYISKDVVLIKVDRNISTDKNATVVRTDIQRNVVNLKSSTSGRVQGTPTEEKLEIGFEKFRDGTIPTFSFVQKGRNHNDKYYDDKYYFEQDSDGYIFYGGEYYTVTYKGEDEPFLLYVSDIREKTNSRQMSGLK